MVRRPPFCQPGLFMSTAAFSIMPSPRIVFGENSVDELPRSAASLIGTRGAVLLVADPGIPALADRVARALEAAGARVARYDDIRSDPMARQVDGAAEAARRHKASCVVGIGGGSALDTAKFAAAIAPAPQPAEHYALAANPLPDAPLAKICIPTTAGTGSEATRVSVFSTREGVKVWAWGEALRPDLAVLDPTLTVGLPPHLTAATGVDALVHAIEACTIRRANLLNDGFCYHAIRLIVRNLRRAIDKPDDLNARGGVQIAATAAGIGIDNSGTGIAHAIGHALGTVGRVHHGRAVGLALRAAIGWNAEVAPARFAAVAGAMGVPTSQRRTTEVAAELAGQYDRFLREVGLDISLRKDGLGPDDVERLVETTQAPENKPMREANCRASTVADLRRICTEILTAA
jgi:alcohol dehydrogenase class IV